jgi:signal transduction histidine kinase
MNDIVLEVIRSAILLIIVINLWIAGKRRADLSRKGWNVLIAGFALLVFGSLIDLTDNFESLNRFVVIGETSTQAFLEKLVGYLGGFLLIAVGLVIWIPTVTSVDTLQQVNEELTSQAKVLQRREVELAERAQEVARANVQLGRSNADLQQFAYAVSHDLQEPLRAVSGFCQLLQQRYHGKLESDAEE